MINAISRIPGQSGAGMIYGDSPATNVDGPRVAPELKTGRGVSTIKRGTHVLRNGIEYRVRAITGRVVNLETLDGSFAFFTTTSLCTVVA